MNDHPGWRERNRAAWETYHQVFAQAQKDCQQRAYGTSSSDGTVQAVMGSDYRIRTLEIHPDVVDEIGEDQLEAAAVSAYNNARKAVHYGQRRIVMQRLGLLTEQEDL